MISEDTKKDIALRILRNELSIMPGEITRFPTGFCHSVYYINSKAGEFVLRVTESKWHYDGSVKWLTELARLDIPIPKILRNGQYEDVYYTLITYIDGKDIGDVYYTLKDYQKRIVIKELVEIQRKVSELSPRLLDGYENCSAIGNFESIKNNIQRIRKNITANKIFNPAVCDAVEDITENLKDYFMSINPVVFLDDIQTKNVLISNGKLVGIVDIDEIGYGDPLVVVGVTNMALLLMKADTNYIDYWLDEMQANDIQRRALTYYTLLSCIEFMGERGANFSNDVLVSTNQDEIELINSIYFELLSKLYSSK